MIALRWAAAPAALFLTLAAPAAGQSRPDPATVAERLTSLGPAVSGDGPFWSPDGARVLYLSGRGGAALWSVPAAGGTPSIVARDIPGQLARLAPSGDRIAYLSDRGGFPEIWIRDLTGPDGADRPPRQLTSLGAKINALSWSPDGRTLALSALRYGQFDLWTVDVATGRVTRVTTDPAYETYPVWTPDGRHLVYVRSDDRWADHDIMVIPAAGGTPRRVVSDTDFFDYGTMGTRARFGYPILSPDGRRVLFPSHRSGWINYWMAALDGTGSPRPLAAEAADQSNAVWAPDGRQVAFVSNRNGTMDLRAVPADGGPVRVVAAVELGVASQPAWAPDGRSLAFTLGTPTRPAEPHVVAATGGTPRRLASSVDDAVLATLVTPSKVTYRSDEFTIPAYLYRPPPGVARARAPGILYIHGGPTGQFADSWLPQPQFLAQMGYVVLAPNIRGSSGYGKAFEDANNPCWTHCDLRDVVAGAEYLRRLPEVDGAWLGITGNSYGGIMSMAAVAHAPEVFQASAPQSGYADWISFMDYNSELQHTKLLAYEWGPWPDSAAVYRRNSSIFSAHRVTAPVLVIQGEGRTPAWRPNPRPIPASKEFVHALDRMNKVVHHKVYPGEDYYVGGRENARQVMLDILRFFDQYLGYGDAATAVSASARAGQR